MKIKDDIITVELTREEYVCIFQTLEHCDPTNVDFPKLLETLFREWQVGMKQRCVK